MNWRFSLPRQVHRVCC